MSDCMEREREGGIGKETGQEKRSNGKARREEGKGRARSGVLDPQVVFGTCPWAIQLKTQPIYTIIYR